MIARVAGKRKVQGPDSKRRSEALELEETPPGEMKL